MGTCTGECVHGQKKLASAAMGLYMGGTTRVGLLTKFYGYVDRAKIDCQKSKVDVIRKKEISQRIFKKSPDLCPPFTLYKPTRREYME